MASYTTFFDFTITDVNGDTAQVRIRTFGADTTTVAGIKTLSDGLNTLLAPLTNGKVTARAATTILDKAQISSGTAPPPSDATYPSVTDGARLNFLNNVGERRVVTIPAPLEHVFKTGSSTVNPDQADVAAFIAEIIALTDEAGATNLYNGGVKVGRPARRRATRKSL